MKTRWLDRRIAAPGPFLALCLSEDEFRRELKRLKLAEPVRHWVNPGANATCHHLLNDGARVAIICLADWRGRDPIEVAGLLIHEAVHVWQEYCDGIGEHQPGREQEAYAVQAIAQELLAEFARRIKEEA